MNIIVVRFVADDTSTMDEIVGAATDWHAALLVARHHASERVLYNCEVNVNRETPVNMTRFILGGNYIMTNVRVLE